jgi:hypothetical protein
MLSNMLRDHPQLLSLSEFFSSVSTGGVIAEPFSAESMDGRRFWEIVTTRTPFNTFALQHGADVSEWLYPYDDAGARFSRETGVPAILLTALPHLTANHDALYDALQEEVSTWGAAAAAEQYQRLFGGLMERFGKRLWVERSGGGTNMVGRFLAMFPNARFIHIVRDGRDTALSMQEHLSFRLFFVMGLLARHLGVDPIESTDRIHVDRVPAELRPFLPESFDSDAFRDFRVPLSVCANLWTQQVVSAIKMLGALPADRLLTLRYEDFFIDPKDRLDRFASFLGEDFVDDAWSTRGAASVRRPRSTWRDLPEETTRVMTAACQHGFDALRAAGTIYDS